MAGQTKADFTQTCKESQHWRMNAQHCSSQKKYRDWTHLFSTQPRGTVTENTLAAQCIQHCVILLNCRGGCKTIQ